LLEVSGVFLLKREFSFIRAPLSVIS